MFSPTHARHYFASGQSALACIDASLRAAGKSEVHRILDFGCGHGRVLRALRKAFPAARITASDVDRDGVNYCARNFDAVGVYSETTASSVTFEDQFDLIWAGSVFTHIDEGAWVDFLGLLRRSLADGGLLVFTAHGPDVERKIRTRENLYSLDQPAVTAVLTNYTARGFGYGDYPGMSGYGIAVVEPQAAHGLIERAGLRVIDYQPTGWDNHQDVFACVQRGHAA